MNAAARSGPSVIAFIPARLGSVRFPRKMLADQTGHPLVWHVHRRALQASLIDRVIVATDDESIAQAVRDFGGESVMTSPMHESGTSRIAEACDIFGLSDDAIVLNVQGDEPEIEPDTIDACARALAATDTPMATIASSFVDGEDPANPNIVKVVLDQRGRALYFSRALIPHDRDGDSGVAPLRHVGIYAYRRSFLREYVNLSPTPLERSERLEQLRVMEHGHAIAVALHQSRSQGIDTAEQYAAFVRRWQASSGAEPGR